MPERNPTSTEDERDGASDAVRPQQPGAPSSDREAGELAHAENGASIDISMA